MDIVVVLVFFSVLLAMSGLALFVWTIRMRSHEHADRLALLPLVDELKTEKNPREIE